MANTNFTAWLGNNTTSGQQAQYNNLTSGFQAGGFVKAEDFNAALRMTTLICAGIVDGFDFPSELNIDSAKSAIANAIKNPVFDSIAADSIMTPTLEPTTTNGIIQIPGALNLTGGITAGGVATFNQSAVFKNIICTTGDGTGAFKSLTSTDITATNITATTTLKAPKANLTNIYGATDSDSVSFPKGATFGTTTTKLTLASNEITGATNVESTKFVVPGSSGDRISFTANNATFNTGVAMNNTLTLSLGSSAYEYKSSSGVINNVESGVYLAQVGSFMKAVTLIPSGKISSSGNYFTTIAMIGTTTEVGLAVSQSTSTFTVTVQSHNLSTNSYSTYTNADLYLKRFVKISL